MEDELIDDMFNLTKSNIEALQLAKKIGGQLAVGFVAVVFMLCLLIAIFSVGDTSFIIGTVGSFFFSAGAAFLFGRKKLAFKY